MQNSTDTQSPYRSLHSSHLTLRLLIDLPNTYTRLSHEKTTKPYYRKVSKFRCTCIHGCHNDHIRCGSLQHDVDDECDVQNDAHFILSNDNRFQEVNGLFMLDSPQVCDNVRWTKRIQEGVREASKKSRNKLRRASVGGISETDHDDQVGGRHHYFSRRQSIGETHISDENEHCEEILATDSSSSEEKNKESPKKNRRTSFDSACMFFNGTKDNSGYKKCSRRRSIGTELFPFTIKENKRDGRYDQFGSITREKTRRRLSPNDLYQSCEEVNNLSTSNWNQSTSFGQSMGTQCSLTDSTYQDERVRRVDRFGSITREKGNRQLSLNNVNQGQRSRREAINHSFFNQPQSAPYVENIDDSKPSRRASFDSLRMILNERKNPSSRKSITEIFLIQ